MKLRQISGEMMRLCRGSDRTLGRIVTVLWENWLGLLEAAKGLEITCEELKQEWKFINEEVSCSTSVDLGDGGGTVSKMTCRGLRSGQSIISHLLLIYPHPFWNPESEIMRVFIQSYEPRAPLHRVMCFVKANSEVLSHFQGSSSVIPST